MPNLPQDFQTYLTAEVTKLNLQDPMSVSNATVGGPTFSTTQEFLSSGVGWAFGWLGTKSGFEMLDPCAMSRFRSYRNFRLAEAHLLYIYMSMCMYTYMLDVSYVVWSVIAKTNK